MHCVSFPSELTSTSMPSTSTIGCISGEIFELKAELNSEKKDRKKEAVKKVIASMTVGKDVRYCSF